MLSAFVDEAANGVTVPHVVESQLELALTAAEAEPPDAGLRAVAALRARLDSLESLHVEKALRAGWSWRQVAEALGVTKQAVHKKHARRIAAKLAEEPADGGGERQRLLVTGQARQSVRLAREEAEALGAPALASEHLLLGLLRDDRGPVVQALRSVGVSLEEARAQVAPSRSGKARAQAGAGVPGERLPVSPDARAVMEQSLREAVRRRDGHLGVEHLLLALLRDTKATPVRVLGALGATVADVERSLDEALGRGA
jgi:ATP-dependent Clp protease ATP-binding subunit ClpA